MPRTAPWGLRTIGLAVVGLVTFITPPSTRAELVTQVIAYAVLCLGMAGWALADLPRNPRPVMRSHGLPVALGAVTAAGCAGSTAGGGGYSLIAFSAVALMVAAEMLPAARWVAIASLGVLATEAGGLAYGQDLGVLLGSPLLLAVGVLFGRNRASLRVQAEQASQLLAQHEELRAEQRRAEVLAERARIAREVHDVLAHSLGALGIQLQAVRALITVHHDEDRALEALAAAQRMASGGLNETRRAVLALRTDTLPLHDELARATAEVAERHQVQVRYQASGVPVALPPEATVALTRIAQESLVNAVKHAPGADIEVDLNYRADGTVLTVSNPLAPRQHGTDGGGTEGGGTDGLHTVDAGYGLVGMRERLLLLGGSLEAGPRDGRWVVVADLPLPAGPHPPEPVPADQLPADQPAPATAADTASPSSTTAAATREGER
jgi:signal transduction histidine kinase